MTRRSLGYPVKEVVEGSTRILVPETIFERIPLRSGTPPKTPVFYNPAMAGSRDVGVLLVESYGARLGGRLRICDALSGSGVRGLRYLVEASTVEHAVLNDISREAANLIEVNAELNGVVDRVTVERRDANLLLSDYAARAERFDLVDVDPFGSPAPYMHNAVRAVRGRGVLAATATDTAPLSGVYPKTCLRRYGAKPLKTEFYPELAVRILVGFIARVGLIYDLKIDVLLAYREAYYVRCYLKVEPGARRADEALERLGFVFYCPRCSSRMTVSLLEAVGGRLVEAVRCKRCGFPTEYSGPLWLGKLVDEDTCRSMIEALDSGKITLSDKSYVKNLLSHILEEAYMPPTYYTSDRVASILKVKPPSLEKVKGILEGEGFKFCRTYFDPKGFKTDAPPDKLLEILKSRLDG